MSLGSAGFPGRNNLFRITLKVAILTACFQSAFAQFTGRFASHLIVNRLENKLINLSVFPVKKK